MGRLAIYSSDVTAGIGSAGSKGKERVSKSSPVASAFMRQKTAAGSGLHITWFLLLVHVVEVSGIDAILKDLPADLLLIVIVKKRLFNH